jgi:multiple sugar transport system ATP-binding protein
MSTLAILCVATSAGYAFARLRFPGRGVLFWTIIATIVVPVFTVLIALFGLMADADLIDRKLGLVLVFVSTTTPLATWLVHNHVKELPAEPEEAALIDGCTRWQAFWHVIVPQMRSGIAALSAIVALSVWGDFLIPLLLTSTSASKPVTVLIPEYVGKYTTNYPLLAAAGVLALLPPAVVALVLNRHKEFPGGIIAVRDISLEVEPGEFVVLVGPSGCGKSTTLRMVAGLEAVTAGQVRIAGRVVTGLPPRHRNVAMIFQNYALYAHMTVRANMGFGLKMAGTPKREIRARVDQTADILGITDLLDRKPRQLSGGQRQRVAMGRAIVREPAAFLMDEPLSNLDAKLRVEMRAEITNVHRRIGAPTLYVTHDQIEAMTMGDRVAILRDGALEQIGTPLELYERPVNVFVAGFVGSPAMNFLPAKLNNSGDAWYASVGGSRVLIPAKARTALRPFAGHEVLLGLRPEDFVATEDVRDGKHGTIHATVARTESLGSELLVYLSMNGVAASRPLTVRLDRRAVVQPGAPARIGVDLERLYFFDPESGAAIR